MVSVLVAFPMLWDFLVHNAGPFDNVAIHGSRNESRADYELALFADKVIHPSRQIFLITGKTVTTDSNGLRRTLIICLDFCDVFHGPSWLLPGQSRLERSRLRLDSDVYTYTVDEESRSVSFKEVYAIKQQVFVTKVVGVWYEKGKNH